MRQQVNLDQILATLRRRGADVTLTPDSYELIADCGFREKTLMLAIVATQILLDAQPLTLRGLFYRVVSAGWLPNTDKAHYQSLMRVMTVLREAEVVPFAWLVDSIRSTVKPSSWSGLLDFADTVARSYRKDFWATLPAYVHVFVEKDAMAGTLAPTTRAYDVPLSVVRGFSGVSYLHDLALHWRDIQKPIFAYYLGDFDPSGLDLERDIEEKLRRYAKRDFTWERLGVNPEDFTDFDLLCLQPKSADIRTKRFLQRGYSQCAELDAMPGEELRARIEQAILSHIPVGEWERLLQIEELEREQWHATMKGFTEARQ